MIGLALLITATQVASDHRPSNRPPSAADVVRLSPGDMLQRLDEFRDGLPLEDRGRLDRALPRDADGGITRCDDAEGSRASCEAAAYMPALRSTGLMQKFLATLPNKR